MSPDSLSTKHLRVTKVREGMLTREEGLMLIEQENIPMYDTLKWFLEIIGLDSTSIVKQINKIPKLY